MSALNKRADDPASTGRTEYRPYFENYTVDASILETARHYHSGFGRGYLWWVDLFNKDLAISVVHSMLCWVFV